MKHVATRPIENIGRLIGPDFARGICITLMVYGHITHVGAWRQYQDLITALIYSFHMPVFLIISGAFFASTTFIKIIRRLVIPYTIMIAAYLIALIAIKYAGIHTNNQPPNSALEFIKIIVFDPRGAYWFLHTIIIIQITFFLCRVTADKNNRSIDFFNFLLATSVFFMLIKLEVVSYKNVLFFILGWFIARSTELANRTKWIHSLVIVFCISIYYQVIYSNFFFQMTWALSIVCALINLGERFSNILIVQLFCWVGRNSLSILLFHAIFIVSLKPISGIFLFVDGTGILYSTIVCITTIAASLWVSRNLDKLGLGLILLGKRSNFSTFS